jgi:glyoxylase-like metal-dependent hydrolase (beta-lactamase superfamily II)
MTLSTVPVEVADRVFKVDAPLGARVVSLYLVCGDDGALLFDTGVDGTIPQFLAGSLSHLGLARTDVRTVVISHCDVDHFGGMSDASELFPDARILAHEQDALQIESFERYLADRGRGFVADYGLDESDSAIAWSRSVTRESRLSGRLADGDAIDLGGRTVEVLHLPGHSRGHLALNVPDAAVILISDAILGEAVPLADGSAAFPPTYRYFTDYLNSISRVRDIAPSLLLTAHYPMMEGTAVESFLDQSVQFAQTLSGIVEATIGAAGSAGLSLAELVNEVNPLVGRWPKQGTETALAFPVAAHLEAMREDGSVVAAEPRDSVPTWRLT